MEKYFKINRMHSETVTDRATTFITSRGCPAPCVFCSIHTVWGYKYRVRSPENVLEKLEELVSRYGVKEILFEDDNLTLQRSRAEKIFDGMAERKLNLKGSVPNRVAVYTLDKKIA